MKRIFILAVSVIALLSCSNNNIDSTSSSLSTSSSEITSSSSSSNENVSSSSTSSEDPNKYHPDMNLYVNPIIGIKEDFIFGMDSSSVISLEDSGVKYYDYDGEERDLFSILSEQGINYIRVRVWNDPYNSEGKGYGGGNSDISKALEIGKRVTKYGMKLLLDFHYSDFWADPSKQQAPKAWKSYDLDTKSNALYQYTLDSLTLLKDNNVDVGMVQVGNETNGKMCGETDFNNVCTLMKSGSKAIREVYPEAMVAVHFTNPEKTNRLSNYATYLKNNNVDYDVFTTSYYPYWHGSLENLASVLNTVATNFNKKVMVMETSYLNTLEDTDYFGNTINSSSVTTSYPFANYAISEQGQMDYLHDLCDTLVNVNNCIGMSYWEGTWISVNKSSYNENFALWQKYGSGWASSYAVEYDPDDAGKWYGGCAVDNEAFFTRNGELRSSIRVFNMLKEEALDDTNYLLNPGFEDEVNEAWTIINNNTDIDELTIREDKDAREGSKTLHFWSSTANKVDFAIEQEINNLKSGTYQYSLYLMGGTASEQEIYTYVKINDNIVYKQNGSITSYNNWDKPVISNINYTEGDKIVVGVYIKINDEGAWGLIDDTSLLRVA